MLLAKVAVAVLLLASLASEAKCHSRLSRVPRSSDDRSFRHEEQDRYFEQCRLVNAWKEHLGYVSVLAFLDPAWQYSFRQAIMLELLSSRLRKSGFPDIRFFVISPPSDSSTENEGSEEDFEVEAWREIGAKHEMESFVDHDFLRSNKSEITFLRDDSRSRMWQRFRASRDQVIVIDRCGKLTYHVIVPWSILFFPYVKAAILSTYEEDPCSGCDPTVYQTPSHEEHVKLTTDEKETNPTQSTETGIDAIWTTENLENATLRHESSKEDREASTASSVPPEEITTDRPIASAESPTESTIYDSAAESRFDGDRSEDARDQEDLMNSGEDDGTIPSGTAATFEPQRDVFPPEQTGSPLPANNNSLTSENHGDRISPDEPATENNPMNEETTTSDLVDEIRDRNTTPEDTESFGKDMFLPLRIIMYAPHIHKNGRKTKKHTHLILKTGDPGFHGHLDFGNDTASLTDPRRGAHSRITSSKEYDWKAMEADADEENQKFTFDADESPGLYGEVADYWKSYEDNDITDRNETFNDTYDNSTTNYNEEHRTNVSDHATSLSKSEESYPVANVTENIPNIGTSIDPQNIVGSNTIESSKVIDTNQMNREEEMRYKLMEHYKKLLPWINYRLSKEITSFF